MKNLLSLLLFIIFCGTFASCQSNKVTEDKEAIQKKSVEDSLKNPKEKIDTSKINEEKPEKTVVKIPQKLDSAIIITKLTKKWEITGNYWVSSTEMFSNNENYFLDLQKSGSYTLKVRLEDMIINETGKWQLQNPKMKFRKYEETDPKETGIVIEETEEILVLTPNNNNKQSSHSKERQFLFSFDEKEFAFHTLTRPSGFFAK